MDLLTEDLKPLSNAGTLIPRVEGRRPIGKSTIWRWATVGCKGVVLETVDIGHIKPTSAPAVTRFLTKIQGDSAKPVRTTRKQKTPTSLKG